MGLYIKTFGTMRRVTKNSWKPVMALFMNSNRFKNILKKKGVNIFCIKHFQGLAMRYKARWLDDIIDNNADRQNYHPF